MMTLMILTIAIWLFICCLAGNLDFEYLFIAFFFAMFFSGFFTSPRVG